MLAHIFSYSWEYDVCVRYIIYWFDTDKSSKNNLKNDGIQLKNNKVDVLLKEFRIRPYTDV